MESDELINRITPLLKRHALPIALATIGLIFLVYGLIVSFGPKDKKDSDIVFSESQTKDIPPKPQKQEGVVVDIQGAVKRPGVYTLPEKSRVQDSLIAAGGLREDANRLFVAKTLNLAQKLTDGVKIYIPFADEQGPVVQTEVLGDSTAAGGQINLNTASSSQLDSLPGIGKVTAEKIISNRPYASVDDLLKKKVVGKSVYEKVKDKITVF